MSLKSQFKTDTTAARDGVWINYSPNSDGTVPGFRLARMSKQNKRYTAKMRDATKAHEGDDGLVNFDNIPEAEAEALLLDVFVDTVLLEWRNVQPEDDGVVLEYSKENATKLLGSDDWADLYGDLSTKARKAATFRQKALEAQAKNS